MPSPQSIPTSAPLTSALPDLDPHDLIGSPYCIQDYVVDKRFGGPEALAVARHQLAARGLRLVLDFVPNHVAPDHIWVQQRPDFFVRGDAQDLAASPDEFFHAPDGILARGCGPNLAPWPDVVQLNAFSTDLRQAAVATLRVIADQCDGVRCDMAMLMTNDVFSRTWGERAGAPPKSDYWPAIIDAVRATHPLFGFIAESYWGTEVALQAQGFDLCYDKRFYDELVGGTAEGLRALLEADPSSQELLVRFIENHDEARAASLLSSARARAAAVVMSTVEGARLYHDGQHEGARVQVPVFLGRRPKEPIDSGLRAFYGTLIRAVGDAEMRGGIWQPCEAAGPDQPALLAWTWTWTTKDRRRVIVVNFADEPAHGRVRLPWDDLAGRTWRLEDELAGSCIERDGRALADDGLQVELTAWGTRLLSLQPRS